MGTTIMKRHSNFGYLVGEGFRAVFKHGFMSFAAICITVACLVIINSFALIAYNMDLMVEDVQKQMRVVVAIDENYSHAEAKSVGSRINLIPNVENAEYLSREDALQNFAEGFDDYVRYGKACGMEVVQEPVFDDGSGRNFSSSEVRRSLIAGKIREATDILGKPYDLEGVVIHGHQLGRKLGYPTANLNPFDKDKIIPSNGVYAATVRLENGEVYPSMVNIGFRPTVDKGTAQLSVESHLIGFNGDIYGQTIVLSFIERIRDERKMSSLEELKSQLAKDYDTALKIITR